MGFEFLIQKSNENELTADWAENQKYFDVAISRYYYCAFQKIIYLSKKNKFYNEIKDNQYSHEKIVTCLIEHLKDKLTDEEKLQLSHMKKLRKVRNKADYYEKKYNQYDYNLAFKFYYNITIGIINRLC